MIAILIAAVTCLVMICSIFFFPHLRLGKRSIDTYWLVALAGALVTVASRQVDLATIGRALVADTSVNPLKILILFLSMTLISVFLDEVGFFHYLAHRTLAFANGHQFRLFAVLYLTVSLLTVFTSNDIIVLTFTPFICYLAKNEHISPTPYLIAEFVAANTMSMMFVIGNPTNIYIASSYGIDFFSYFKVMALPTLAASLTAFLVLCLLFHRSLRMPTHVEPESSKIKSKPLLVIGLADLVICTLLLVFSSYLDVEMWAVSLAAVTALFLSVGLYCLVRRESPEELKATLKRGPWQLVPFMLSMFVLVLSLSQVGVPEWIEAHLGEGHPVFAYGVASFLSANLINNIPMSVLFCPVIGKLPVMSQLPAAYAAIVGSNLGAYLTPIGALAGIMWLSLLKNHGVKFRCLDFIRYGAAVALPALAAALFSLSLVL